MRQRNQGKDRGNAHIKMFCFIQRFVIKISKPRPWQPWTDYLGGANVQRPLQTRENIH